MKVISRATIKEHQVALYRLLQAFDAICSKHGIRYMLFAGTALGAVRHQGFIPWDDDLDVVMLRPEYEYFLAAAEQELDQKFFLQKEFSDHWPMFFSKLRMNGTTCLERFIPKDPKIHQGVYIDIFPCDNLSDNSLMRKLQFVASKVVIAKSLSSRGYLTDRKTKRCFMWFCGVLPMKPFIKLVQLKKRAATTYVHTFFGGASRYDRNIYPREWISQVVRLPFEDGLYPVSSCYDALLTALYGDYMVCLPEEKRGCKVHAELVDLEHPYTEYLEYQRSLTFEEFTRSIR